MLIMKWNWTLFHSLSPCLSITIVYLAILEDINLEQDKASLKLNKFYYT